MRAEIETQSIVEYLDSLLSIADTPDDPRAVNGLQVGNRGRVTKVAAAVDFSTDTVRSAVENGADLLLVHHGMFWSGLAPFRDSRLDAMRMMLDNDVALYAAHLPLDRHERFGNSLLLAHELGLEPKAEFARYQTIHVGVRGEADVPTAGLLARAQEFAAKHGGTARVSPISSDHRTRRWAICSGAGASADTLGEAAELGIDTLIVGEGPHWSAVAAAEAGRAIIYAGHYATETLGVRALATHLGEKFGIESSFVDHPTGL